MAFRFRAYALEFESAFECLGFEEMVNADCPPDVYISLGSVLPKLDDPSIETDFYQVSSNKFLLTIPDVARYLVTNGKKIEIDPYPDADLGKVRLFLFGSALGALLYQRALFPLHGSAVETPYGAMIFVGPQGVGKSTLAAHFKRHGYQLLSDDVCAITRDKKGNLIVLPAFPLMRLCTDAYERLSAVDPAVISARFDVDKYLIQFADCHSKQSVKLCAIHLLSDHEQSEIVQRSVLGFERLTLLFDNLYRPSYLRGFDSRGDIMKLASSIANQTVVTEIIRPRDVARIDDLVVYLEKEWQRNYHKKKKTLAGCIA